MAQGSTHRSAADKARESLTAFAAGCPTAGGPAGYLRFGNILVSEDALAREPGLRARLPAGSEAPGRIELPASARLAILSPRAVRLLQLDADPATTAKIFYPGELRKGAIRSGRYSFRHEVRLRRAAGAIHPAIGAPALVGCDARQRWFVEAFVETRRMDPHRIPDFLLNMSAFYRRSARHRPLSRLRRHAELVADAARLAPAGTPMPAPHQTLPFSICHGDLFPTNIIPRSGGYTLIDWEYAAVMPAAFDLARLYQFDANLMRPIVETLAGIGGDGPDVVPPPMQLALGALDLTRELRSPGDEWQTRRIEKLGVSRAEADTQKAVFRNQADLYIRRIFDRT